MAFLPDVNFWLALTFQRHQHYQSASAWFAANSADQCLFCRMTQQGFLRLATNPQALGRDAVSLSEAWRLYDSLLSDPCIGFSPEPPGIEFRWRKFTDSRAFSPKVWNDAYLAAFAIEGGYELITFDKAFSQYNGLTALIL